ncbi:MAG: bifunctional phosphoribosylaminoimidazolecarboxamide formyltransferase/IMP cyclohydrolase [Saprospiraceae bacterium]|jgi:phosphoribosylaminoimidazolecarboxamide formyltransferase/IMP cyclohydrolase|nr:bifunctional phosphoribosylaminoimidazolecarboxamide formyltransferase/IMP cyclohydrolase [Saprospiraceae bacterium]
MSLSNTRIIKSALVSVFSKEGLDPIIHKLHALGVKLYSTGGTQSYIQSLDIPVSPVEELTGYPSILDGRVKTLHPAVFGGILARREPAHLSQLTQYHIPEIDCVIVDLYPFEDTVANTDNESDIIEKIDIGGVSLIRAAAKNWRDVAIVGSRAEYSHFLELLNTQNGELSADNRRELARKAFAVTSHYDTAIFNWFNKDSGEYAFKQSISESESLRYGENPHQSAVFYGDLTAVFDKLNGKAVSYNNLVDIDAAVQLMREFKDGDPCFAILKHTNACGLARRVTAVEAWNAALACDTTSAFGGIFITNTTVDLATAKEINKLFYEVLIAPSFDEDALELLRKKDQRILLKIKSFDVASRSFRTLLNGVVEQDSDLRAETLNDLKAVTNRQPSGDETDALLFASRCCKHLKSNAIALVKDNQLIGMGCGQPNRVDALRQAIAKATLFGFDVRGAVMASDAFFPFPDCVEIAYEAGITAVIQPGGSLKDQDSIDAANERGMAMVTTGVRHFRH